jgi:protein-disulfide isomerase
MIAFSRRLALVMVATLALAACNKGGKTGAEATDMTMGPASAKVQVVEYASLSCPHCARFNNDVFPLFKKKYIDTGLVHYTFREFLTEPVPLAAAGALLARCSGKDKFFGVLDAVFHGQEEIYRTGDVRGVLLRIAQSSGMTEAQFEACVGDEAAQKALAKRVDSYSQKEKISATPTFIINGKKLEGEVTMAQFDETIQPLLK